MNREKTIIKTSFVGVIANIVLVGIKATIGVIAGSVAIINDAINNLTDALSSLITIIGTKLSGKKPDRKHPFGHGRIEYITSFLIAALIFVAGGVAIYESVVSIVDYFQEGIKPDYSVISLVIIGVAILVKVFISVFYRIQGKKTDSEALKASSTDAFWDIILSSATLVGALFSYTLGWYIEGYLGIVIGFFIIKSGIDVLKDSISSIIGERYDDKETADIIEDINNIEGVKGTYDLILNSYGHNRNIGSAHILVDSDLTAVQIQAIQRNIQTMMFLKHKTIMTVGIYADNIDTEESKEIYASLTKKMTTNKNILQMHGFYVDVEKKICNFDLVISFDEKEPEKVIEDIQSALKQEYPDFSFYINLDRDFSLSTQED